MNDRYLFKGKRTDNGEWVKGNLIHSKKGYCICTNPYECMSEHSSLNGQSYGFGGFKLVDPSTICQCTGLKDKNGKLIWENDIIKGKYYSDHRDESNDDKRLVLWDDDKSAFCPFYWFNGNSFDISTYEVVGNSFDNPELLEVGE